MGLGKTCQTIAFLGYIIEQQPTKVHLVIVPSSTRENWSRELTQWLPGLKFEVYCGSLEERRMMRKKIQKKRAKRQINLVLTTYDYVYSKQEDRDFFQKKMKFEYSVYDEAHMLKNMATIRYKNLTVNNK